MPFLRCTTGVRSLRSTAASPTGRRFRLRSSAIVMRWSAATTAVPANRSTGELKDNLYFFAGDADTYFLNNSTMELDAWLKTTTVPRSQAQFMYGNLKPHCWQGPVTPEQRIIEIA